MKAYKHILIATDFTKCSEEAAKRAVDLARRFNAKLTFLHVIVKLSVLPRRSMPT